MALNPEISLGIRPQQPVALPLIHSPLDRYQKVLTLRHLMQQGQLGQMNIEQTRLENERLQRTAQDEQKLGSWMQQNQQRPDLTPQEIVAAHPNPTGIKFATAWSAQQTAALTQHKAFLDNAFEEAKTDDRIYNSVTPKDPQSKYAALTELVRLKRLTGEQAAQIAGLPDEEFQSLQQRAAAQSLDRLQRIKARQDEIALRIAEITEKSVTAGGIAEGEKKVLDAAQAQKAADAATVAAAFEQSPQAGAAVIATLAKSNPKRAEPFQNVRTAAQARAVGSTVAEQQTAAHAARVAELTESGQTATQAHQIVLAEEALQRTYHDMFRPYQLTSDAYSALRAAKDSPEQTKDLVYTIQLMKMLDPTSAVLGNERADVEGRTGVDAWVRNLYNSVFEGHRLTPELRSQIEKQADALYKQRTADYANREEEFRQTAIRQGLNPKNVIVHFTSTEPPKPPKQESPVEGVVKRANAPAAAQTPPQAGPAPAEVEALLKTSKPGTYTLSDGTKWQKNLTGPPTQVQ